MYRCQSSKYHVNLVEHFKHEGNTYIVTRFARGGDLLSYLTERGVHRLPEEEAKQIFHQVVLGVRDMHVQQICHRDLKHLNVFLSNNSSSPKVKIGDFGLSCHLNEGEQIIKRAGTIGFMAPEVVMDEPSDFKADIWSLGVMLYALLSSRVPFSGSTKDETAEKICQAPLSFERSAWKEVSSGCQGLLTQMLEKDQTARLSIEEVLAHPWFAQNSSK